MQPARTPQLAAIKQLSTRTSRFTQCKGLWWAVEWLTKAAGETEPPDRLTFRGLFQLSRWVQCTHKGFQKGSTGSRSATVTARLCLWLLALNTEGTVSQGMWVATRSWKRQGNQAIPGAFRKQCSALVDILVFTRQDSSQTCELLNRKTLCLCCFKPLLL